ncbi:carnitine 3-dehydrogenase [Granulosicoccus antarcticus]|nr:carnitine 3-dehydrogenase [Granulosicoccus antarcticus]
MKTSSRRRAAIIGGGVIGGGWAARFLLNGWDVAVFDPDPEAERKVREVLANARRSLPALYDILLPAEGQLSFHAQLAECVSNAIWIQESVPERLDMKHRILAELQTYADDNAIIASSTSGFKASELNAQGANAIVAHPFNPVYLLPLVELVGDATLTTQAADILHSIGMFPLTVRKEIDAHIADRLLEAVWRESLWLVSDGIATTEEIDDAIRMGFGLRWAQMGLFETYRIAGGESGMRHFMEQFGPALEWPWTKLMDVPDFTPELVDLIVEQSDAQSGHLPIRDLERQRDDNLIGLLRALKKSGHGAGTVLNTHEKTLIPQNASDASAQPIGGSEGAISSPLVSLPVTFSCQIPNTWTDYNGHMNETHYVEAASRATDRFMELIGADAAYIASGKSFFTVESHVRYLDEARADETLTVRTQVLPTQGKKLHLFHHLSTDADKPVATVETLLLHMDLESRRSCPPESVVAERLATFATAQAQLMMPEGFGRAVGQKP